jgi:hypothetical protein
MFHKLKTLDMALVAVLALTAVAASATNYTAPATQPRRQASAQRQRYICY